MISLAGGLWGMDVPKAQEKSEVWLILGGKIWHGDDHRWGKDIYVLDSLEHEGSPQSIKANFNDVEELDTRLQDDFFDVIVFDRQSARYAQWDRTHLAVVYKKLKKGGKLCIEFEFNPTILGPDRSTSKEEYERQYREYLEQKKDVLINGMNCRGQTTSENMAFFRAFMPTFHEHNTRLLTSIFGDRVRTQRLPLYPIRYTEEVHALGRSAVFYEAIKQ